MRPRVEVRDLVVGILVVCVSPVLLACSRSQIEVSGVCQLDRANG
jgi:hypothetical protein